MQYNYHPPKTFHLAVELARKGQTFLSLSQYQKSELYRAYASDKPDVYANILLLNPHSLNRYLNALLSRDGISIAEEFSVVFSSLVSKEIDSEIEDILYDAYEFLGFSNNFNEDLITC